jgi:hypothetical protein
MYLPALAYLDAPPAPINSDFLFLTAILNYVHHEEGTYECSFSEFLDPRGTEAGTTTYFR